jgi:hypothetical protein
VSPIFTDVYYEAVIPRGFWRGTQRRLERVEKCVEITPYRKNNPYLNGLPDMLF